MTFSSVLSGPLGREAPGRALLTQSPNAVPMRKEREGMMRGESATQCSVIVGMEPLELVAGATVYQDSQQVITIRSFHSGYHGMMQAHSEPESASQPQVPDPSAFPASRCLPGRRPAPNGPDVRAETVDSTTRMPTCPKHKGASRTYNLLCNTPTVTHPTDRSALSRRIYDQ